MSYDEFGVPEVSATTASSANTLSQSNPQDFHDLHLFNPFGFTGYQSDNISGMYYAQARFYNPTIGRFTAEDPIKDQLNWYGYCRANPIAFIDPSGLAGCACGNGCENTVTPGQSNPTPTTPTPPAPTTPTPTRPPNACGQHTCRCPQPQATNQNNDSTGQASGTTTPIITQRDEWGAIDNIFVRFDEVVTTIVVHHTASGYLPGGSLAPVGGRDSGVYSVTQRVRNIDHGHDVTNGWGGVGYHFLIGYDGSIFQGRELYYRGRHARLGRPYDRDPTSIGIAFLGTLNYDNSATDAQIESFLWLIDYVREQVPTINRVEPHWEGRGYLGYWFQDLNLCD